MILSDVGVGHLEGEDDSATGIDGGSRRMDISNHRLGGIDRDVAHNLSGLAKRIGGDDRDGVTTIIGDGDRLAERPIVTETDRFSITAVDLDSDPGDGDTSDMGISSACNGDGLGVGKQIVRRGGDVEGRSCGRMVKFDVRTAPALPSLSANSKVTLLAPSERFFAVYLTRVLPASLPEPASMVYPSASPAFNGIAVSFTFSLKLALFKPDPPLSVTAMSTF